MSMDPPGFLNGPGADEAAWWRDARNLQEMAHFDTRLPQGHPEALQLVAMLPDTFG